MTENFGHDVFFKNKYLQKKYGRGFYVITDADIVPNEALPENFMDIFIQHLIKFWGEITKVGFALKIDDIPNENIHKARILNYEKKFWIEKFQSDIYIAPLDTTFSLYKPGYPNKYNHTSFWSAHRFSGNYIAKHGGWYVDQGNLTEEQEYYLKTASISSSWVKMERGLKSK